MDQLVYEKDAYYIFDRGYADFSRLYTYSEAKSGPSSFSISIEIFIKFLLKKAAA